MRARSVWLAVLGAMFLMTITSGTLVPPCTAGSGEPVVKLVNINTASPGELVTLPGIGRSKADAIVSYRNTHGPFSSVNELTRIRGIGKNILDKIRDLVRVK